MTGHSQSGLTAFLLMACLSASRRQIFRKEKTGMVQAPSGLSFFAVKLAFAKTFGIRAFGPSSSYFVCLQIADCPYQYCVKCENALSAY